MTIPWSGEQFIVIRDFTHHSPAYVTSNLVSITQLPSCVVHFILVLQTDRRVTSSTMLILPLVPICVSHFDCTVNSMLATVGCLVGNILHMCSMGNCIRSVDVSHSFRHQPAFGSLRRQPIFIRFYAWSVRTRLWRSCTYWPSVVTLSILGIRRPLSLYASVE